MTTSDIADDAIIIIFDLITKDVLENEEVTASDSHAHEHNRQKQDTAHYNEQSEEHRSEHSMLNHLRKK